jgi:hypothetical protein
MSGELPGQTVAQQTYVRFLETVDHAVLPANPQPANPPAPVPSALALLQDDSLGAAIVRRALSAAASSTRAVQRSSSYHPPRVLV